MNTNSDEQLEIYLTLEALMLQTVVVVSLLLSLLMTPERHYHSRHEQIRRYSILNRIPRQVRRVWELVEINDDDCRNHLRMDRNAFGRLCVLLETCGGLTNSKYVSVQEMVAMFLSILSHHKKNRIVKYNFLRSGQTVSKHFHSVLRAVLKLHTILLAKPDAISSECQDPRWNCFEGCLGALDGTYIAVKVRGVDQARYKNRKGHISVNVLGVCDQYMNFVYVLCGWEGSAADSRVLRDAVARPHGLKVPKGQYYLCDNGYTNGEGFLTSYKGNVIERTFGLLKMRWAILRSASSYPIKVHNHIIMACCLLHNFIRKEMTIDPIEHLLDELIESQNNDEIAHEQIIDVVESSLEWNAWRNARAQHMFNEWMQRL